MESFKQFAKDYEKESGNSLTEMETEFNSNMKTLKKDFGGLLKEQGSQYAAAIKEVLD